MIAVSDAVAKMQTLSEERAAREALADGEAPVPWADAKARLDALHGIR